MHEVVQATILFTPFSEVLKVTERNKHIFVSLTDYGRICIYISSAFDWKKFLFIYSQPESLIPAFLNNNDLFPSTHFSGAGSKKHGLCSFADY